MSDGTKFISADRIKPGWELRVPPGAQVDQDHPVVEHEVVEHQVVVEEGDTLSQIALEELGDADAYPQIFEASKDIAQPGGRHLVDPDVIDVGWTVTIPGQVAPVDHESEPKPDTVPDVDVPPTDQQQRRSHAPTAVTPTPPVTEAPSTPDAQAAEDAQPAHLGHGRPGRAERGRRRRDHRSCGRCWPPLCASRWEPWDWWRPTGVASSGAAGSVERSHRRPPELARGGAGDRRARLRGAGGRRVPRPGAAARRRVLQGGGPPASPAGRRRAGR